MSFRISDLREQYIFERDKIEFALADTLDVKTSVILIVIVFLAEQSRHFLESNPSYYMHWIQFASVTALVLAGIFAVFELCPRDYWQADTPTRWDEWIAKLKAHYSESDNPDSLVLEQAMEGHTEMARKRTEKNILTNKRKAVYLQIAFWFTIASFTLNLLTLVMHLF
jgi:hypothetical protein